MSSHRRRLREEMRHLAEELDARPSVVPRVMCELRRRGIQRDRIAVADRKLKWVTRPVTRYAAALGGAVVLALAFVIWLKPVGPGTSIAFADVQQAIRRIETAIVVSENPGRPFWNHRVLYLRDSDLVRKEWRNGVVHMDDGQGKQLALNTCDKTAQLCVGSVADSSPRDYLDDLANIPRDSVSQLGERTVNGKILVGFTVPDRRTLANSGRLRGEVWVDPVSRLPVREEWVPTDPDDFVSAMWRSTTFYTFNVPVDESLFRMTPPEGYTILEGHHWRRSMMPPVAEVPDDADLASPKIDPPRGIGPACFGMSVKDVLQVLGRPDEMNYVLELSPADKQRTEQMYEELFAKLKAKNFDAFEENRLRQEMHKKLNTSLQPTRVSGITIEYVARGFSVIVDDQSGLQAIFCRAGDMAVRDFTGKTTAGIGMGATLEEIERAYGPADTKHEDPARNEVSLYYKSLCMLLGLSGGRLCDLSINLTDKGQN